MVKREYNTIDRIGQKGEGGSLLTSKFFNLDEQKQLRILNAAIYEFAQKGYDQASTNGIVKSAGISKGLLFHYFKSKKDLYLFLHQHFVEVLKTEFFSELQLDEPDVFVRIKNIMMMKSQMMKKHPEIFNFLMSAYMENSSEVKHELDHNHHALMHSSYAKILEDIDQTKFREGVDMNRAVQIVFWVLEGFSNQVLEKTKLLAQSNNGLTDEFTEADVYIEMLKKAFYK